MIQFEVVVVEFTLKVIGDHRNWRHFSSIYPSYHLITIEKFKHRKCNFKLSGNNLDSKFIDLKLVNHIDIQIQRFLWFLHDIYLE